MRRFAVLIALFFFAGLRVDAWEKDFAENPSVEEDRNRDGVPDGWKASAFKSPAKPDWDRSVAHSGQASLRISDSANPAGKDWDEKTGRWMSATRREVVPGEKYTLTVWVKTKDVTGGASACIAWFSDRKWLKEDYTKRVSGTTDWKQFSITAQAPPQAAWAMVYLCLSDSSGSAWFDDIHMVKGDSFPRNFQPVDISGLCDAGFADEIAGDGKGGWTDQGRNDMRNLPHGDLNLRGVPFHIIDAKENKDAACIVLKGKGRETFPSTVAIPISRKCETIYILHCCAWGRDGEQVADYEIIYDDGASVKVPLRKGREIMDWWKCGDTKGAAAGWEGTNAESGSVGLTIFPLANTRPQTAIREIRFSSVGKAVPILVAVTTADGPPVLAELPMRYEFTDTKDWYEFTFPLDDTNLDTINLTRFLDAPAGKHGFLTVRDDGHFYFQDGTRARFFGTNIGGYRCFMEKEKSEVFAARMAKYGVNLLRIHAIDGKWGKFIDYSKGDSRHFLADQFDRLDYLFAQLKKRGIYIYFDMLDYRDFAEGDGVKDASQFEHGWHNSIKGATIFNDRLIELQKEFAEEFFTHYNPYTKLRYVDDPAVAVVETTNENSVFYFSNTTLTLPCYVEELRQRWNQWLLRTYGDRAKLSAAWTNLQGECALLPDEDPARGTVILPLKYLYQDPNEASYVGERSPARVNAMVRFFFELERRYYTQMREQLKKIGIKVPITGTNQTFCPASNYADTINDFMSRNNYWCHPNVHAKPIFTFRNLAMVNSDIPRASNPVAEVASSTSVGKPMIVPEFNFPWPNEFRAECLPLMAAYACLQDWDGLLFFAYSPDEKTLQMFSNQSDPVRWGQFPAAALLFHRNDVAVAKNTVHVGYSEQGIFSAQPSHGRAVSSPFRYLPYISKVRNDYFTDSYKGDADVVVASGDSPDAVYAAARRAIVSARNPWVDWNHKQRNRAVCALPIAPNVSFAKHDGMIPLVFQGFLWANKTLDIAPDTLADAASLPEGALPIGLTGDRKRCLGFITDRFCVVPDARALASADAVWDYRLFAESAKRWGLLDYKDFADREEKYVSDTGQLRLNQGNGIFTIAAQRTKAAVGFLGKEGRIDLDGVSMECRTPFAAVMAASLDEKPIGESRHLLLTAVARAEDSGQAFGKNHTIVPEHGRLPVLAEPVDCELAIRAAGPATVYALDETGKRRDRLESRFADGMLHLNTVKVRSPWCEIVVE